MSSFFKKFFNWKALNNNKTHQTKSEQSKKASFLPNESPNPKMNPAQQQTDEPVPDFLMQSWIDFNSQFIESDFLVYGVPEKGDFLGRASVYKQKAKQATKQRKFDIAWWLLNQQKSMYMQHANREGFGAREVIQLDSGPHLDMANVLRLEGKHKDALCHMLYRTAGTIKPVTVAEIKKIKAYFNRAKLKNVDFDFVLKFTIDQKSHPDFREIQAEVSEWA